MRVKGRDVSLARQQEPLKGGQTPHSSPTAPPATGTLEEANAIDGARKE